MCLLPAICPTALALVPVVAVVAVVLIVLAMGVEMNGGDDGWYHCTGGKKTEQRTETGIQVGVMENDGVAELESLYASNNTLNHCCSKYATSLCRVMQCCSQ